MMQSQCGYNTSVRTTEPHFCSHILRRDRRKLATRSKLWRHIQPSSIRRRTAIASLLDDDAAHFSRAKPAPAANTAFVFGLGYVGVAVAATLQRQGWHVGGTCRDEDACDSLRMEGIDAYVLDADNDVYLSADAEHAIAAAKYIVTTVPPVGDFDEDPVLLACRDHLANLAPSLKWVGYISSTSVYGDHNGEWVNESSSCKANAGKALARLKAEQAWAMLHHQHGLPLHTFRLGGIYGPGRSALDAVTLQVQSSSQERRGQQRYTGRCHVHDICKVLLASMRQPHPGAVYNIVDDDPAPRGEVMAYARHLLGLEDLPSTGQSSGSSSTAQSGLAEKRVSNQRIKDELDIELTFPSFREGLSAICKGKKTPYMVCKLLDGSVV